MVFRVSGRGRIGADGLAFWYTTSKGAYDGTVFGSSDQWNGLGLFFDSFDNDNKHNNPYIYPVINDGTQMFDHSKWVFHFILSVFYFFFLFNFYIYLYSDGATQLLQGCLRDFRNKPFPTRARIEYYQNVLTVIFWFFKFKKWNKGFFFFHFISVNLINLLQVLINPGLTNNEKDLEMCFRAENIVLPKGGYFGISAATGGLADDHDVFHFLTSSIHVPGQISRDGPQVSVAEEAKLQQEYEDYEKKLNQQKEEYKKYVFIDSQQVAIW